MTNRKPIFCRECREQGLGWTDEDGNVNLAVKVPEGQTHVHGQLRDGALHLVCPSCGVVNELGHRGVCDCFVTKPCRVCLGEGLLLDGAACPANDCKNGRVREPRCERCESEGRP